MSTPRRALGAGPAANPKSDFGFPAPRLLPAERLANAEHEQLLVDGDEHQAVADAKGRRILGPGIARTPEGLVGK